MKKENLLFNIGNTPTKVRITHARRSLLYFIKDFINFELSPHQEMLIKYMGMKEAHKRNYGKR